MVNKIRRQLRELAVWLLIGATVSLAVDHFRQSALLQSASATSPQTLDGSTLGLNAMNRQKPLLLYVWATWCGVCRYTTPSMASLTADGDNVLTVALRSGDNAALEEWLTRKKTTLPTANDPSGQLARQQDTQITSTLVVVYRDEVKSVITGWTSGWGMRLRLWLASWQTVGFPGSRCVQPGYGQASLGNPDKAQPSSGKVTLQTRQAQRRWAIDIHGLFTARQLKKTARHMRRFVIQQPGNGPSDLFRLAIVLHRQRIFYPVHTFRLAAGGVHLGINQSRTHAVHPDPLRRHFQR